MSKKTLSTKSYLWIRIAVVILLSSVFSYSLEARNYILPVAALVIGSVVLYSLKSKVKSVTADERDYEVAGHAARWAMSTYCFICIGASFIFFALRDTNPYFNVIGSLLSYSACFLLIIYVLIYKFYNKFSGYGWKKSLGYFIVLALIALVVFVATVRIMSVEDGWLCQNGNWVKHGQPDFPAPTTECKK